MKIATDDFWIETIAGAREDLNASREWTERCREMLFAAVARQNEDQQRYDRMVREHEGKA